MIAAMIQYMLVYFLLRGETGVFLVLLLGTGGLFAKKPGHLIMILLILLGVGLSLWLKFPLEEGWTALEGDLHYLDPLGREDPYLREGATGKKIMLENFDIPGVDDGDRIRVTGQLRVNDVAFDFLSYDPGLHERSKNFYYVLPVEEGNLLESRRSLRARVLGRLHENFQTRFGQVGPLLLTLFFGTREALSGETLDLFNHFGLTHLLVVSGLHVSIIAGSLSEGLRRMGVFYWLRKALVVALLLLLALLSGFHVSVLRGVGQELYRELATRLEAPYDAPTALGVLGILFVVHNPYVVYSLGFQLSFLAALALGDGIKALGFVKVYTGIFPLLLVIEPVFNLLSLPVNLLLVGLMSLILPLSLLVALLPMPLMIFDGLVRTVYEGILWGLEGLEGITLGVLRLKTPIEPVLWLYYLALFLKWLLGESLEDLGRARSILYGLVLGLGLTVHGLFHQLTHDALFFLDAGNADGALWRYDGRVVMMDAGQSYEMGRFLDYLGVGVIDVAWLSHGHLDHYGGLRHMTEKKIDILLLEDPGILKEVEILYNQLVITGAGDAFSLGEGSFEVLWPPKGLDVPDKNQHSLVVLATCRGLGVLYTGDILADNEKALPRVEAAVLKVPHHGSDTSSSEAWIQGLSPVIAVVSVGEDNPHGHPSPEVIKVLETHGRRVFITRDTGTILMKFDPGKNRIRYKFL